MRFALAIVVLMMLAGCGSVPQRPVAVIGSDGGARIPLVWHMVQDPEATCRAFLNVTAKSRRIAAGCSGWRNGEFHVISSVVRYEEQFCTVGHEVGHGHPQLGLFHDNDGNWIRRKSNGISK
jgi:uncharacterized protein YceK